MSTTGSMAPGKGGSGDPPKKFIRVRVNDNPLVQPKKKPVRRELPSRQAVAASRSSASQSGPSIDVPMSGATTLSPVPSPSSPPVPSLSSPPAPSPSLPPSNVAARNHSMMAQPIAKNFYPVTFLPLPDKGKGKAQEGSALANLNPEVNEALGAAKIVFEARKKEDEAEIRRLEDEVTAKQRTINAINRNVSDQTGALRVKLFAAEKARDAAKQERLNMEGEINMLREHLKKATSEVENKDGEMTTLRSEFNNVLDEAFREVQKRDDVITSLKEESQRLKKESEEAKDREVKQAVLNTSTDLRQTIRTELVQQLEERYVTDLEREVNIRLEKEMAAWLEQNKSALESQFESAKKQTQDAVVKEAKEFYDPRIESLVVKINDLTNSKNELSLKVQSLEASHTEYLSPREPTRASESVLGSHQVDTMISDSQKKLGQEREALESDRILLEEHRQVLDQSIGQQITKTSEAQREHAALAAEYQDYRLQASEQIQKLKSELSEAEASTELAHSRATSVELKLAKERTNSAKELKLVTDRGNVCKALLASRVEDLDTARMELSETKKSLDLEKRRNAILKRLKDEAEEAWEIAQDEVEGLELERERLQTVLDRKDQAERSCRAWSTLDQQRIYQQYLNDTEPRPPTLREVKAIQERERCSKSTQTPSTSTSTANCTITIRTIASFPPTQLEPLVPVVATSPSFYGGFHGLEICFLFLFLVVFAGLSFQF